MPSADKYNWWFTLMLDLWYVNELKYVRKLNEIETVETWTIINEMMPKFYYYILAAELAQKPYTEPPAVTTENISLDFNEDTVR